MLSLYADVDAETLEVLSTESRLERLRIESNLRHDRLDAMVTEEHDRQRLDSIRHTLRNWARCGRLLASFWRDREQVRGRPEPIGRVDYSFELDGVDDQARVTDPTAPPRSAARLDRR